MSVSVVRGRTATVYEWVIGVVGVIVGASFVPQITQHNLFVTLFIFALAVILEARPIPLGRLVSSLLIALPIGTMVVYGPGEAICLMIVAELLSPFVTRIRTRLATQVFNAGQYAISTLVMVTVYRLMTGAPHSHTQLTWFTFYEILIAVIGFVVTNHLFIHVLSVLRGTFEPSDILPVIAADGLNVLLALPFSFLMIEISPAHPVLAPVMMIPIAILGQMLRLQRQSAFLQRVYALSTQLTAEFHLDRICERVAISTHDLAYADAVAVLVFTEDRSTLEPQAIYPPDAADRFQVNRGSDIERDLFYRSARGTEWVYIPDARRHPDLKEIRASLPYLSLAVFPFQSHNRPQGAIVCYASRPYAFGELTGSISVLASQLAVLVENAILYRQLHEQSTRDGATNLYNYRYFYEALARELDLALEAGTPLSVAILDIDFFKNFNDTYGHLAGDSVLRSVGQTLVECLGPDAIVARYGGEEFGVLIRADVEEARSLVESVRQKISVMTVQFNGYELKGISISAGIASYPDHAENDRELLLKADSAMYWGAKQRGRDRTALYTPELDQKLFVDSLTGLFTYHYVTLRTREEFLHCNQWGVICIDLVRFSEVNTSYGFAEGDSVLREVSLRLRESLRHNELACRFGGDEFLILVPRVSQSEAEVIADRLTKAVASASVPISGNVFAPIRCRTIVQVYDDLADPVDLFTKIGTLFVNLQREADESVAR